MPNLVFGPLLFAVEVYVTYQLNVNDLQLPRSQSELHDWVMQTLNLFASSNQGRTAVRLKNKGCSLVKQFMEELFPLMLFADGFYSSNDAVLFQLVIGNQSYDALILERATRKPIEYLQITQSFDGYQNSLRMLHLEQYGHAPVTGPTLSKNNVGAVSETNAEVVQHDSVLNNTFENIRLSVERKLKMRYESNTSLIVNVESSHFLDEYDTAALHEFIAKEISPFIKHFISLYLVSDRQGFAFRYAAI